MSAGKNKRYLTPSATCDEGASQSSGDAGLSFLRVPFLRDVGSVLKGCPFCTVPQRKRRNTHTHTCPRPELEEIHNPKVEDSALAGLLGGLPTKAARKPSWQVPSPDFFWTHWVICFGPGAEIS